MPGKDLTTGLYTSSPKVVFKCGTMPKESQLWPRSRAGKKPKPVGFV